MHLGKSPPCATLLLSNPGEGAALSDRSEWQTLWREGGRLGGDPELSGSPLPLHGPDPHTSNAAVQDPRPMLTIFRAPPIPGRFHGRMAPGQGPLQGCACGQRPLLPRPGLHHIQPPQPGTRCSWTACLHYMRVLKSTRCHLEVEFICHVPGMCGVGDRLAAATNGGTGRATDRNGGKPSPIKRTTCRKKADALNIPVPCRRDVLHAYTRGRFMGGFSESVLGVPSCEKLCTTKGEEMLPRGIPPAAAPPLGVIAPAAFRRGPPCEPRTRRVWEKGF